MTMTQDMELWTLVANASFLVKAVMLLLLAVIEKFSGGPVGLENLAHVIGEEAETIEDVLEPYLIQCGYLQRTPRGRMATLSAYRHFGITAPAGAQDLLGERDPAPR